MMKKVLEKKEEWYIVYLTREPEGECKSPDPAIKF